MPEYALVKDGAILEYRNYAPVNVPTLAPDKPRMLPVVVENETYDHVVQVREGPTLIVEPTRVRRVYTVRDKTAEEIAQLRVLKVASIRREAERRIIAIMPEYMQRNVLAQSVEMMTAYGADPENWPSEARSLHTTTMAKWATIKEIRATSNAKEAEVAMLSSPSEIFNYDVAAGW